MRRTSARQTDLPPPTDDAGGPSLAAIPCRRPRCGRLGAVVICLGVNDNGAIEFGFCSIACAQRCGWPPWPSEQPKARRKRA